MSTGSYLGPSTDTRKHCCKTSAFNYCYLDSIILQVQHLPDVIAASITDVTATAWWRHEHLPWHYTLSPHQLVRKNGIEANRRLCRLQCSPRRGAMWLSSIASFLVGLAHTLSTSLMGIASYSDHVTESKSIYPLEIIIIIIIIIITMLCF